MHTLMQVSAEMEIPVDLVMQQCISCALGNAKFDKNENAGFEVMQACISYAHTYASFGKNGNGKNCGGA